MKKIAVILSLLVIGLIAHQALRSETLTREALNDLDKWYEYFIVLEATDEEPMKYIYADNGPHVHVYEVEKGKAKLAWETSNMGAPITTLLVADLDRDGKASIVLTTLNGRIVAYDLHNYERVWENFEEPFKSITCLAAANVDKDPQDEVVFIAERIDGRGSFLFIFDSVSRALQWQSQENFIASELLVANVDDDPQPEIILNSGFVIDSRFYNIDLVKREGGGFGEKITLRDLNSDGYPEVIGRLPNRMLKVYDLYAQRDIW